MDRSRPHWSYSSLNQYLRCPLQFYFQRVMGLQSPTIGSGLALGSAVHAALAEYHTQLKDEVAIDTEAVVESYHRSWEVNAASKAIQFREGDSKEDSIAQGLELLELYLKGPPPTGILAVEHEFVVPLHNSEGEYLETPLVAITDLITAQEEQVTIQEFKTSARSYSELDVASSLQPICYVHAVRECMDLEAEVEYTVLVKTKTPKIQRIKANRSSEDVGRLGDLVQTIERAVELEVFYPIESPLNCGGCPYRKECRDWKPTASAETLELSAEAVPC